MPIKPALANKQLTYLTSGAGGMFCGSCMHDNALSKALRDYGWNIQLVPTYTPIRTDEDNVSVDHVLFGGINVYLQQKIPLLRYVPSVLDRFLSTPWLIRRVTSRAAETDMTMLSKLAHSMLLGSQGNQRKEVKQVCKWLKHQQPDLILFSNILIGGCIPDLKRELGVPILVTLQGDDVFLDSLKPAYREKCIALITEIATQVDGFIVQSNFFRDYMSRYFSIPLDKFHVTPLGMDAHDFPSVFPQRARTDRPPTIGYLARLAKEKGLHHLVDAFIKLKSKPGNEDVRLKLAGWLSVENKSFAQEQWHRLEQAGLGDQFEYVGSIDRTEKLKFFNDIDVFSVPAEFLEPKGLYVLESLAAGIPVVLPAHGAFPELIETTAGGLLFPPGDTDQLAASLSLLLRDHDQRARLAAAGHAHVHAQRNSTSMADSTTAVLERFLTSS